MIRLDDYDKFLVMFSGGKDSLACLLHLLDSGVEPHKIELWHQNVDGDPSEPGLMDWDETPEYIGSIAQRFGLVLLYQWKDGGFEREMLRDQQRTAGVWYETIDGRVSYLAPSKQGKVSTRRKFPQVGASLMTRWCSAYLKIDVAARVLRNDQRFKGIKTLVVTGERAEESANRAKYLESETHRAHLPKKRVIHHWRPVLRWTESQVWDTIERHNVTPHDAYRLGFSRVSCMACIFGNADQWATVRHLDPERFERIAAYEREFGTTIHRKHDVVALADQGKPYAASLKPLRPTKRWELPAGAFGYSGGPV